VPCRDVHSGLDSIETAAEDWSGEPAAGSRTATGRTAAGGSPSRRQPAAHSRPPHRTGAVSGRQPSTWPSAAPNCSPPAHWRCAHRCCCAAVLPSELAATVRCGGGQYVILGLARGHLACGTRPGTVFGVSVPPRLLVTGNSGSGKTTLARLLASDLGIPHVELDGLYHGPGWTPADPDKFRARVRAATAEPAWVIDGNYTSIVGQILRDRAGLVIALDLPRWRVMARITRRTLARIVTRAELWNGNREQWRNLLTLDPDNNIVLWAWTRHRKYHQRAVAEEHVEHRHGPPTVRLASPAQVRRFRRLLLSRVERPYRDARTTRSRSRNLFRSKWPGLGALRPSAA